MAVSESRVRLDFPLTRVDSAMVRRGKSSLTLLSEARGLTLLARYSITTAVPLAHTISIEPPWPRVS